MVYVPFMKDFSVQEKILFCQPLPARAKQDRSSRLWMILFQESFIEADDNAREILF